MKFFKEKSEKIYGDNSEVVIEEEGLNFPKPLTPKIIKEEENFDPYASRLSEKQVNFVKENYNIYFNKGESSEMICIKMEDKINDIIKKAKDAYKECESMERQMINSNKFGTDELKEELEYYKEGSKLLREAKEVEEIYKIYIDSISPEIAKVFDIPDEIDLGRSQKIRLQELFDHLNFSNEIYEKIHPYEDKNSESFIKSKEKVGDSFWNMRIEKNDSNEVEYKVFIQDKDQQNIVEGDSNEDLRGDLTHALTLHQRETETLMSLPEERLKLIAKILKLYDLPEFADRKITIQELAKTIKDTLYSRSDILNKYRDDPYFKKREFHEEKYSITQSLISRLEYAHKDNISLITKKKLYSKAA